MRHIIFAGSILLVIEITVAGDPAPRTLTFEDRVKAQETVERGYYSHQIGATKSFEQAVPRAVAEGKVRKYSTFRCAHSLRRERCDLRIPPVGW